MALLAIEDLTVHFKMRRGFSRSSAEISRAVDGVSLEVDEGETVALVGESGCGKSTLARAVLGLCPATGGRIVFQGEDLVLNKRREHRRLRADMQIVFQDPYSSLSPRMTVREIINEPLRARSRRGKGGTNDQLLALLTMVGLGTQHLWRRPHEFSGGQCQRIAIARALAPEPKLVVLDEPTSALDVSVQARILVLLQDLQRKFNLSYLFIAHDLAVVEAVASRVAVMYLGKIVEQGLADLVLGSPRHPYTVALIDSVPSPDPSTRSEFRALEGDVPSSINPPSGCPFHPRCAYRLSRCDTQEPPLRALPKGRQLACHLPLGVVKETGASSRDGDGRAEPG